MARVVHEYVGKPKPPKRQRIEDQFAASKTRALDVRSQLLGFVGGTARFTHRTRAGCPSVDHILTAFRQRSLSVPTAWSRRLLGIDDARQMSEALREMMTALLEDLSDLPQQVTDPDYNPENGTGRSATDANGNGKGKTLVEVFANEKSDGIDIVW